MTQSNSPSARAAAATKAHLAQFTDEDMAYHEAGHAVVHHLNGGAINRLSIERTDPRRGTQPASTRPEPPAADQKKALDDRIALLVGGDVAGTLHGTAEQLVTAGSRVDHDQALWAASEAGIAPDAARAMIDDAWSRVRDQLQEPANWQLVESLAQELLRRKTLDAGQINAILTS